MNRDTQHAVLGLLGAALLRIALDDTFLRYVRPEHRWPLIAAGAVMIVLAVTAAVRDRVAAARTSRSEGHDHGGAGAYVPWLLVLPVLVLALVPPPALGADSVDRVVARDAAPRGLSDFDPLPPGPSPELPIAELVQRATFDEAGTLDGREVTLTGFVVQDDTGPQLARLTIFCCAADARISRVRMVGDLAGLGDLPEDTWLQIRGTVQPGTSTAATTYIPAMTVSAAEAVSPPPDPYEY